MGPKHFIFREQLIQRSLLEHEVCRNHLGTISFKLWL